MFLLHPSKETGKTDFSTRQLPNLGWDVPFDDCLILEVVSFYVLESTQQGKIPLTFNSDFPVMNLSGFDGICLHVCMSFQCLFSHQI